MTIKTYQPQHKEACLAIFKSNMPKYFMVEEFDLFSKFLDDRTLDGRYFVVEKEGQLLACGGCYKDKRFQKQGLSWGMVNANYHGQGIGKLLTTYRIQKLKEAFPNEIYMVVTSQHTFQFYQNRGFVVKTITPNGFGEGLDQYYMEYQP